MKMNFFVRNVSDIVCLRTWNEHFDLKDVLSAPFIYNIYRQKSFSVSVSSLEKS